MKAKRWLLLAAIVALVQAQAAISADPVPTDKWPPALPTANGDGTATLTTPDFLVIPESVKKVLDTKAEAAKLTVAKAAPTVDLAYHAPLPDAALNGTGWSSWGDICLASDGKVYSGTGDHGGYEKGRCFIFVWDPAKKAMRKIADVNQVSGAVPGDVHFSKVHAGIWEGKDRKIYFTCTLDDGGTAGNETMLKKWNDRIPGGLIYQYDPATEKTVVYAKLPPARVTATTLYDPQRDVLYCCIEGAQGPGPGRNDLTSLGVFDMQKKEWVFQSQPGTVGLDRNIFMDSQGNVYFNGKEEPAKYAARLKAAQDKHEADYAAAKAKAEAAKQPEPKKPDFVKPSEFAAATLWKYDPKTRTIAPTKSSFSDAGVRSSTRESKAGYIYGNTMGNKLFRYSPAKDELTMLGSNFLTGEYITVCDLSPDDKYVYYFPGAHGSAGSSGTAVIQYDIASGTQKALAFLYDPMVKAFNYAPGGTYGIKISQDGSTLYVGLNGAPPDPVRPKGIGAGFGLTSFAAIRIPASERGGK